MDSTGAGCQSNFSYPSPLGNAMTRYKDLDFEVFSPVRNELGEGPIYDGTTAELIWFDIVSQVMFVGNTNQGTIKSYGFGEPVSAAFLTNSDILLVAAASGVIAFDRGTGRRTINLSLEASNSLTRANDSRTAPNSAIWLSTMGLGQESGAGSVYHLRSGVCTRLFDKMTVPNAICFSPDGETAYFCDTPKRMIMKTRIDPETSLPVGKPSAFIDLTSEKINPDGAVIDSEGSLWNAQWGAGRVACYDSSGRFVRAIELPATQITCPAFGGSDLKHLYVTSAYGGISRSEQPEAGAVFVIEVDVPGLAERRVHLKQG